MCFSEKASFSAAILLTVVSGACFAAAGKKTKYYPLAAIPLFCALQQYAEGFQWLYFKRDWGTPEVLNAARQVFVFIAYCLWPAWIPLSLYTPEMIPDRKKCLFLFSLAGGAYAFYNALTVFPHSSTAINNSIYYFTPIPYAALGPYLIFVILPWFISSLPKTSLIGLAFFISVLIATFFYAATFTSVWCFFAALVSSLIFLALKEKI